MYRLIERRNPVGAAPDACEGIDYFISVVLGIVTYGAIAWAAAWLHFIVSKGH